MLFPNVGHPAKIVYDSKLVAPENCFPERSVRSYSVTAVFHGFPDLSFLKTYVPDKRVQSTSVFVVTELLLPGLPQSPLLSLQAVRLTLSFSLDALLMYLTVRQTCFTSFLCNLLIIFKAKY